MKYIHDKKDGGVVNQLIWHIDKMIKNKDYGKSSLLGIKSSVKEIARYVTGLENASRRLLNDRYYRIVDLEKQIKEIKMNAREQLMSLLKDCYEDQMCHTELRMIRDRQGPRFKNLS